MPDANTTPVPTRKKGRAVLLGISILWIICMVGLYWMIVRLKVRGVDGIRDQPAGPPAAETAR